MNGERLGPGLLWRLGLAQLIGWGVTFYLPGVFAQAMAADLGWSRALVFSGLSLAMLMMGVVSPLAGHSISRHGGRRVMLCGALLNVVGCLLLALCQTRCGYFAAWVVLGVGMRLSLYDAAFATLVGIVGAAAAPAMQRITLLGGLASAVFWPLGALLLDSVGWRAAISIYAVFALVAVALLLGLPPARVTVPAPCAPGPLFDGAGRSRLPGLLFSVSIMLTAFLAAGLSAHLPALLSGFGVPAAWAALWGIGQVCARLLDMRFAQRLDALQLNLWIGLGLPLCFLLGLFAGRAGWLAALFVFAYGACNGLSTRVRAALPLRLFAASDYARKTGSLLLPSFVLAALVPWCYALLRQAWGDQATLGVSLLLALLLLLVAWALWRHARQHEPGLRFT